ncbi:MAG: hypothetical protein LBS21_12645 [Clostridiales bacterium]|jgi:hypothetical protein|nr:hypothetical protein [Clostridiales bacterium]
MKATRISAIFLILAITTAILTSCGGDRPPNGRYEAADTDIMLSFQAIIIDGDNITTVMPVTGMGTTFKYTYNSNTGVITATDGGVGASVFEYKDGSIWLGEIEYVKE